MATKSDKELRASLEKAKLLIKEAAELLDWNFDVLYDLRWEIEAEEKRMGQYLKALKGEADE